jgi:hypothetical protein
MTEYRRIKPAVKKREKSSKGKKSNYGTLIKVVSIANVVSGAIYTLIKIGETVFPHFHTLHFYQPYKLQSGQRTVVDAILKDYPEKKSDTLFEIKRLVNAPIRFEKKIHQLKNLLEDYERAEKRNAKGILLVVLSPKYKQDRIKLQKNVRETIRKMGLLGRIDCHVIAENDLATAQSCL